MESSKIQTALDYWRERLTQSYGENHILNITLYGSQNYKIDTEFSDIDVKAIYVPSLRDAVLEPHWVSIEHHNDQNEHCELKDIREMCKMYKKQNINFLETLFTDYRWDNPIYEDIHNRLRENAENIAHYNSWYGIKSVCGQALNTIKQIQGNSGWENKKMAKVIHLYLYLIKYLDGKDYKTCIEVGEDEKFLHYNARPLLLTLKAGKLPSLPTSDQHFFLNKQDGAAAMLKTYFTNMSQTAQFDDDDKNIWNLLRNISYDTIMRYEEWTSI